MLYLVGGFGFRWGLLLVGYLFVNAEPARLARILKWTGIAVAGLAVVALAISGRLSLLLTPLLFAVPALRRLRTMFAGFRGPSAGSSSTVETPLVRMSLDHHTGHMAGTVLRGRSAGLRPESLGPAHLLALWREWP